MKIKILDKAKKKKFLNEVNDLGLEKIPELLIRSGNEKIRAYTGDLSTEQIMEIWRLFPIEGIGLYVGKEIIDKNGIRETRLTLDGMHLWQNQLTKKIIELTNEQETEWFKGSEIELNESQINLDMKGFVSVKSFDGKDFLGVAKIGNQGKSLFGFLPKERRRKSQLL